MKKLKGDIARKEGMLNAMQAELDKVGLPLTCHIGLSGSNRCRGHVCIYTVQTI